jgi:hypothetical protein
LHLALRAFDLLDVGAVLINQVQRGAWKTCLTRNTRERFRREGIRYAMEEMTELKR